MDGKEKTAILGTHFRSVR